MKEELLTVKMANEEYPEFSTQKLNFAIRQGALKARKLGTKYHFTRAALNEYLGISNSDNSLDKDLEIQRLKNELNICKQQLQTISTLLNTCNNLLNVQI